MSYIVGIQTTAGLGDTGVYALLLCNNSQTPMVEVPVEGADSWYYGDVVVPPGGPYPIQIYEAGTGNLIGNDLAPYTEIPAPATSGYNPERDTIVYRALRMVGAYASSDAPRLEQVNDAVTALNMMLKAWQIENHLWLKKFAVLTLVEGQNTYQIGAESPDTCFYQGTIQKADRPTRIFSATRKQSSGSEIPLSSCSRADFHNLPNKAMRGRITQYYYDPQLGTGNFSVWPTPDNSGDTIVLSLDRPLSDALNSEDTFDMPQEWLDSLCYGLALRIAPEYGLSLTERQLLAQEYAAFKTPLMEYDREDTSVFFSRARH